MHLQSFLHIHHFCKFNTLRCHLVLCIHSLGQLQNYAFFHNAYSFSSSFVQVQHYSCIMHPHIHLGKSNIMHIVIMHSMKLYVTSNFQFLHTLDHHYTYYFMQILHFKKCKIIYKNINSKKVHFKSWLPSPLQSSSF